MLSYPIDEAETLLDSKLKAAQTSLSNCEEDLDFIREQITVRGLGPGRELESANTLVDNGGRYRACIQLGSRAEAKGKAGKRRKGRGKRGRKVVKLDCDTPSAVTLDTSRARQSVKIVRHDENLYRHRSKQLHAKILHHFMHFILKF